MRTANTQYRFRAILCSLALFAAAAHAEETYLVGHISNVTFAGDSTLIKLDTGLPGNCVGTPYGWILIPAANKPMTAFVIGLWLRGDPGAVQVTVYTTAIGSSGYCTANQIDPAG